MTLLVETSRGYANLCRILTEAHAGTRRAGREDREPLAPSVGQEFVEEHADGLDLPLRLRPQRPRRARPERRSRGSRGRSAASSFFVELQRPYERGDVRRNAALRDLAEHLGVATVATGNVHAHAPRRTLLQDTLVAIRCRTSLDGSEQERRGNRESILRAPAEIADRFAGIDPAAAARTVEIAERLQFDLTAGARLPLPRLLRRRPSRRSGSSPRSATTPSPIATHQVTACCSRGLVPASRASSR